MWEPTISREIALELTICSGPGATDQHRPVTLQQNNRCKKKYRFGTTLLLHFNGTYPLQHHSAAIDAVGGKSFIIAWKHERIDQRLKKRR